MKMLEWKSQPVMRPAVDQDFKKLNGLQRAAASWLYFLRCWEHWAFPNGEIREWLRQNSCAFAWLIIPAVSVMPVVGIILWQMDGWLSLLVSMSGHLLHLAFFLPVVWILRRMIRAFR